MWYENPSIVAALSGLFGALAGLAANIYLGRLKHLQDSSQSKQQLQVSSGDALRDDLFELIDKQDKNAATQEERIAKQQVTIDGILESNGKLQKDKVLLEIQVAQLLYDKEKLATKVAELQDTIQVIQQKLVSKE